MLVEWWLVVLTAVETGTPEPVTITVVSAFLGFWTAMTDRTEEIADEVFLMVWGQVVQAAALWVSATEEALRAAASARAARTGTATISKRMVADEVWMWLEKRG